MNALPFVLLWMYFYPFILLIKIGYKPLSFAVDHLKYNHPKIMAGSVVSAITSILIALYFHVKLDFNFAMHGFPLVQKIMEVLLGQVNVSHYLTSANISELILNIMGFGQIWGILIIVLFFSSPFLMIGISFSLFKAIKVSMDIFFLTTQNDTTFIIKAFFIALITVGADVFLAGKTATITYTLAGTIGLLIYILFAVITDD